MVRDDALLAFERHATSKTQECRRPAERRHARISRRGLALDCFRFASAPGDARSRRSLRNRGRDQRRQDFQSRRSRAAGGNLDHHSRSLLQYSRAQEISEGRIYRALAHRFAGHALRAGASRQAFRIALRDQRHAGRAAGRRSQRARLSGFRQRGARPTDSHRRPAAPGTHRPAAASTLATRRGGRRPKDPGEMRLHGFVSKPEIQKLNRNSIYIFVNGRLIRDRLIQHAITEAYRNILPPTVFPVVLLFLEMPTDEVDVNVHPSKTEVRFRQQSVPARLRARLGARRADEGASRAAVRVRDPRASHRQPLADSRRSRGAPSRRWRSAVSSTRRTLAASRCRPRACRPMNERFQFQGGIAVEANAAVVAGRAAADARSRRRLHSGVCRRTRGPQPARAIAGIAEAAGPDSRVVHPRRESRRPVDHRPARCPRARAVRKSPEAARRARRSKASAC